MKNSRYHILGEIGCGQFGQVFCASDRITGQLVAMKKLEPLRFPTHRFLRELAVLVRLDHPNVVGLHGLEYATAGRYLVIDYCQGGTLRQLMESRLEIPLAQKLQIVRDILLGLEHVHNHQIIHCDLKPENILLKVVSQGWSAQIADFGIAHFQEGAESHDSDGHTGSPAYMAPERFYGQYSPESDLYAVGVMLFELVVGRRPFSGMPLDVMKAHLNQPLRVPTSTLPVLKRIIHKALQKLPQHRYPSAAAMGMMIEAVIATLNHSEIQLELSRPVKRDDAEIDAGINTEINTGIRTTAQSKDSSSRIREITFEPEHLQERLNLNGSVQGLWQRPQGCLVAYRQGQSLLLAKLQPQDPVQPLSPWGERIELLLNTAALDLDPQGQWIAALPASIETGKSDEVSLAQPSNRELYLSRLSQGQCFRYPLKVQADRLWCCSNRHVLVACTPIPGSEVTLQLWSRRGQLCWTYTLPTPLRQAVQIGRDRLFAITDEAEPMALWIDLLPFKIRQVSLGVRSDYIGVTRWGYLLTSQAGVLTYLNRRGRIMARATLPLSKNSRVNAIAADSSHLWVAVQTDIQANRQGEPQSTLIRINLDHQLPKALLLL